MPQSFKQPSARGLDFSYAANRAWNGCSKDLCISSFGMSGDIPVTGDWTGNGVSKIGVFRPSTGEWFLDLNGNGKWDGSSLDLYVPGYGQAGDGKGEFKTGPQYRETIQGAGNDL